MYILYAIIDIYIHIIIYTKKWGAVAKTPKEKQVLYVLETERSRYPLGHMEEAERIKGNTLREVTRGKTM